MLETIHSGDVEAHLEYLLEKVSIVYQKIYAPDEVTVIKYEALAYFPGHDTETVIKQFEDNIAFLQRLTSAIIEQVLAFVETTMEDHGIKLPPIAINLPPQLVAYWKTLPEDIKAALTKHHLSGTSIQLEVTERGMLSIHKETIATLQQQLRRCGIKTAFDDLGDAQAEKYHLPIASEKEYILGTDFAGFKTSVDHLLAEDIGGIAEIMKQAKEHSLCIVIERVETRAELAKVLAKLAEYGIPREKIGIQGYLFSRPQKAKDLLAELRQPREYRFAA